MNNQIKNIANSFINFDDQYILLIRNGVDACKKLLDSDGIWKRLELKWLLEYFENNEEYEKCVIISKVMENNFILNKNEQKILNDKLKTKLR